MRHFPVIAWLDFFVDVALVVIVPHCKNTPLKNWEGYELLGNCTFTYLCEPSSHQLCQRISGKLDVQSALTTGNMDLAQHLRGGIDHYLKAFVDQRQR